MGLLDSTCKATTFVVDSCRRLLTEHRRELKAIGVVDRGASSDAAVPTDRQRAGNGCGAGAETRTGNIYRKAKASAGEESREALCTGGVGA